MQVVVSLPPFTLAGNRARTVAKTRPSLVETLLGRCPTEAARQASEQTGKQASERAFGAMHNTHHPHNLRLSVDNDLADHAGDGSLQVRVSDVGEPRRLAVLQRGVDDVIGIGREEGREREQTRHIESSLRDRRSN